MKFKSQILTQASGSVGGSTFSRNAGGMYIRARAIPTNPGTAEQNAVRWIMADLTSRWNNLLTDEQRLGWKLYSDNVQLPNTLGEQIKVGAMPMFIRSNLPRYQVGLTGVDDAPTTYNLGEFTAPVLGTVDASAGNLSLAFTNSDEWANEVGSSMLVYVSRPANNSRFFFNGPYRYAGRINGAASPPSSPATIALPFPVAAGNKVFIQVRVSRVDGRLSSAFRDGNIVSA